MEESLKDAEGQVDIKDRLLFNFEHLITDKHGVKLALCQ